MACGPRSLEAPRRPPDRAAIIPAAKTPCQPGSTPRHSRLFLPLGARSLSVRLAHVGIAVRSIADARIFYEEVLGLAVESIEEIASEGVRVAFLPFAGGEIELLEPLDDDSPLGRFLSKHGEGLHHLALRVPDVRRAIHAGLEHGVDTVGEAPRPGAEGREIAFFHPLFTHGVLVEVAGPRPTDPG